MNTIIGYVVKIIFWIAVGYIFAQFYPLNTVPAKPNQMQVTSYFECVGNNRRKMSELVGHCAVNCQIDIGRLCKNITQYP